MPSIRPPSTSPTARPAPPAGTAAAASPTWPRTATGSWSSAAVTGCSSAVAADPSGPAEGGRGLMLATLVGLSLLLALVGGTATLLGCLLARRLRARQARRHPAQAAAREQT